jgi:hypothetical protein
MNQITACLRLCDEIIKAIETNDLKLASNPARQLTEQAAEVRTGCPDDRDGVVVSTLLSKLNEALSNDNIESAKACVQLLQLLLAEEAASGFWGES